MKTSLKMDKTRVMVTYDDLPTSNIDRARLFEWVDAARRGHWGEASYGPSKVGSTSWVNLRMPSGGTIYVKYGYLTKKHRIWLEFNPSKSSDESLVWLKFHVHQLFEHGTDTLFHFGVVTRAEFAVDVVDALFDEYCFFDQVSKASDATFLKKGTLYIGSNGSDRQTICYNKSKERLERDGELIPPTVRIETKLQRKRSFPLNKLMSLPPPMTSVLVVARSALANSHHSLVKALYKRIQSGKKGSQAPYLLFPTYQRKLLTGALLKLQVEWWLPDKIWENLPAACAWLPELLNFHPSIG